MFKNKLLFIYRILIRNTIGNFMSLFLKRNKKRCVLGLRLQERNDDAFFHNAKYMFLYLSKTKNMDCAWLCDNKIMRKKIKEAGYNNVYARNSIKGIFYTLTSKYFLFDIHPHNITYYFSHGATLINFWHGTSWKKIGKDGGMLHNKIYESLSIKTNYFTINNDYEKQVYKTAFNMKEEDLIPICSPRLDALFNDIENANLFMEKDFEYIKQLKASGKKLIIYMPTYRDTGKDISGWLKDPYVKDFLIKNNTVLICKLHALDRNLLAEDNNDDDCFYKMQSDSDVYPILKYTDGLITDYSSIALDYLLLDKPIIYYPVDLEEYLENCRGFYVEYDEFVAGDKVCNESELIVSMTKIINGIDDYTAKRENLKNKMFYYVDGKNCEKMTNFLLDWNK